MVRKKRSSSRNRNGGYDLSAAEQATPKRGRSDTGVIKASRRHGQPSQGHENPTGAARRSRRSRRGSRQEEAAHGADHSSAQQLHDEASSNGVHDAAEKPSRKQAMREAATLAAAHIAAEESGRIHRQRSRNPEGADARGGHDPLAPSAPASDSGYAGPRHSLSTGEQERISVGYTGSASEDATGKSKKLSRDAASYSTDRYKARKKKTSGRKKGLVAALVVVVIALVGVGTAAALWYSGIADSLRGNSQISATLGSDNGEPYYVLLLGGDSRSDDPQDDYGNRTDSIMVARVDEQNKDVSILSIPRDTRVYIEGHGMQKINSAIEFGGYDGVVTEVNELLGIQINYYAFIYFDGFEELVDKLGGVTVAVPEGTYYKGVSVPAGDAVDITGEEALVLARCRHGNPPDQGAYAMGDYQRALNQRNLIKAIAKKVLAQDVTKLPDLISSLSECVETDMDVSKIVSLAQNMKGYDVSKIKADTLPYAGASIDGAWYAILYEDVFEDVKANFTAGKDPYQGLANYDVEVNGDDIGSDYTDGSLYAYTQYSTRYGEYKGKGTPKQLSTSSSSS